MRLPEPDEHSIQRTLVQYLRVTHVDAVWFSVPNGGYGISSHMAVRLKQEGSLAGVSDLVFIGPGGRAYCLEMKTRTGKQSEAQILFGSRVISKGGEYAVARSFDQALDILRQWGLIR